ncbi:MAG: hypothetical protein OSJ70_10555 [Bacilli bacterium]|nr:hypothetical protein [Bacilli bacterium]MCX4366194.1 hypothetical protein [Bacilli bacterium]
MILKVKDKEYSFTATMKKIVAMNKKLKVKNLRDAFFRALNNVDFEFLADFLLAFADEPKELNNDSNKVYDLMEAWVNEATEEDPRNYEDIYKLLAEEINDKSFFGKKMTEKELKAQMDNPLADFDINQVISNTAEKVMGEVVAEEFKGYKG